jgi:hypothetical protein
MSDRNHNPIDLSAITNHVQMLHQAAGRYEGGGKLIVASYGEIPLTGSNNGKPVGTPITPKVVHFSVNDKEGMVAAIERLSQEQHRNVYSPLVIMRPDLEKGKKGGEKDVVAVFGLVLDFDDSRASEYLSRSPLPLDYILETSQGRYQGFYFLESPISQNEAKELAHRLCQFSRCDHGTKDVCHVWRVAGCLNWPNAKKIAEGRPNEPQTVQIVQSWSKSLTPVKLLWQALESVTVEANTSDTHRDNSHQTDVASNDLPSIDLDNLQGVDLEQIHLFCEADKRFAQTWYRKRKFPSGGDSASEYDIALVNFGVDSGMTDEEIAGLVVTWRRIHHEDVGKITDRKDYLPNLITKVKSERGQNGGEAALVISQAKAANDAAIIFDNINAFAPLSRAEWGKVRADLKEHFASKLNLRDLDAAVAEARAAHARGEVSESGLPRIICSDRPLRDITDDTTTALEEANDPPKVFIHDGELVRIRTDEDGKPAIEALNEHSGRHILSQVADFAVGTKDGFFRDVPPQREIVFSVLTRGDWKLPALQGVVETPTFRKDGTIIITPGYDASTGLAYIPPPGLTIPNIPDNPTKEDAERAAEKLLNEFLCDFPFEKDHSNDQRLSASRANMMALITTPPVRQVIDGPTPLAVVSSTQAGHGKGLLADGTALITTGRPASMFGAPERNRDEDWDKLIASVLRKGGGYGIFCFDNVEGRLQSASLARAITARTYGSRLLSTNKTIEVPVMVTWIVNGNNVFLGGDLHRRSYWICLDAKMAKPFLRQQFRHRDLIGWISQHRGELIAALLTMVRAWFVAGKPPGKNLPPFGGFEKWANTVGGILEYAGVKGFLGNLIKMFDRTDEESQQWEVFLSEWLDRFASYDGTFSRDSEKCSRPITVNHLVGELRDRDFRLRELLPETLLDKFEEGGPGFARKLGIVLRKKKGARFGDRALYLKSIPEMDSRSKAYGWCVCEGSHSGKKDENGQEQ